MNPVKKNFLDLLYKDACAVGLEYQIDPKILLAQAAHETAWCKAVKGNNLYGIKAGKSWDGQVVDFNTHEVVDGQSVGMTAAFRAYPSYRDSMKDYCKLLSTSPRYYLAWHDRDSYDMYFEQLMAAGYATDPKYADKLRAVYVSVLRAIDEWKEPEHGKI